MRSSFLAAFGLALFSIGAIVTVGTTTTGAAIGVAPSAGTPFLGIVLLGLGGLLTVGGTGLDRLLGRASRGVSRAATAAVAAAAIASASPAPLDAQGPHVIRASMHTIDRRKPYPVSHAYELAPGSKPAGRSGRKISGGTEAVNTPRSHTDYLIIHQTQGGEEGAIPRIHKNGTANYIIGFDGTVYPIVPEGYIADHAGRSMHNGVTDLSARSIGIEVAGWFDKALTKEQYTSLKQLVTDVKKRYGIKDDHVLGHYEVACCRVNSSVREPNQRGGRYDGALIDWNRIGVHHKKADPDVAAGRLIMNPEYATEMRKLGVFPEGIKTPAGKSFQHVTRPDATRTPASTAPTRTVHQSGIDVVTRDHTPYGIAGDDYDDPSTVYVFGDGSGKILTGDRISDWDKIPAGTRVYTGTSVQEVQNRLRPGLTLDPHQSVWQQLGPAYSDPSTVYVRPDGSTVSGNKIGSHPSIPQGTVAVTGAVHYSRLGADVDVGKLVSSEHQKHGTHELVFVFPDHSVHQASAMARTTRVPKGTAVIARDR